jgi:hypothetical protein
MYVFFYVQPQRVWNFELELFHVAVHFHFYDSHGKKSISVSFSLTSSGNGFPLSTCLQVANHLKTRITHHVSETREIQQMILQLEMILFMPITRIDY